MTEQQMRQLVVKTLVMVDAFSVENPVRPGTPDVNTTMGWIELKILQDWPVRPATPIRVPCFTPQQRVFLDRRWKFGAGSFFLIKINRDWLLFGGHTAAASIGRMSKAEMLESCLLHLTQLNGKKLALCLRDYRLGSRSPCVQST